jgi:hypothetical protein
LALVSHTSNDLSALQLKREQVEVKQSQAGADLRNATAIYEEASKELIDAEQEHNRPKKEGWAAFYAMLQVSDSVLKMKQSVELASHALPSNTPAACSALVAEASAQLAAESRSEPPPQFVSIFDINDLLGYQLPKTFCSRYRGVSFQNAQARWARNFLRLYASPVRAHMGYASDKRTIELLATGQSESARISTCQHSD